jgi:hypothetical protein
MPTEGGTVAEIVAKFAERQAVRKEIAEKFAAERRRAATANLTKARLIRRKRKLTVFGSPRVDDDDDDSPVPPAHDTSWQSLCSPLLEALDGQRMAFDEIEEWGKGRWKGARLRQMLAWLSFNGLVAFRGGYWTSAKSPPREPPPGYGESRSDDEPRSGEFPSGSESEPTEKMP